MRTPWLSADIGAKFVPLPVRREMAVWAAAVINVQIWEVYLTAELMHLMEMMKLCEIARNTVPFLCRHGRICATLPRDRLPGMAGSLPVTTFQRQSHRGVLQSRSQTHKTRNHLQKIPNTLSGRVIASPSGVCCHRFFTLHTEFFQILLLNCRFVLNVHITVQFYNRRKYAL